MGMHLNVEFFDLGFVHYVLRIHKNVKVHGSCQTRCT